MMVDYDRLRAAYEQVRDELLAERTADGHWVGELSSSALSTATAVSALAVVRRVQGSEGRGQETGDRKETAHASHSSPPSDSFQESLIRRGVAWLVTQQNPDGGFGDTDLSHSNIATTYLVVAALHLAGVADEHPELIARAKAYIDAKGRLNGLRERYGVDKTFVVPIMTNLALAGLVEWREVDPLPFELACVPQSWYRFVGMPVVSYAIPALVAIGQARFFHAPPRNPITRLIRRLSISRSLHVLRRMQPDSGGYLEATPLTSFVVMSLASVLVAGSKWQVASSKLNVERSMLEAGETTAAGPVAEEVIREGVKFLVSSVRPDGSWPIDTNLATWNTTLAINALAGAGENVAELLGPQCLEWLLSCQHTQRHPFTGADPGGFGWSDLSGAVPDADDTPGALIALGAWASSSSCSTVQRRQIESAALQAIGWLFGLQNFDGGWPTFCRGWGRLPFDRSGTDLTAHVLRALRRWPIEKDKLALLPPNEPVHEFDDADRWTWFLKKKQHPDGSWSPLWFGNQDHPEEDNPVYGTAKVLMAYRDLRLLDSLEAQRGVAWLVANQNEDGGWGSCVWGRAAEVQIENCELQIANCDAPNQSGEESSICNLQSPICNLQSSVEETALAVEALLDACPAAACSPSPASSPAATAAHGGLHWLLDRVEAGQHRQPAPIGFYFAKLWYYERLYPLIFTTAALGRACRLFARLESHATTPSDAP